MKLGMMFFKGEGFIPFFVRLITWDGRSLESFKRTPSHVALVWVLDSGEIIEIEAVVTGIKKEILQKVPENGMIHIEWFCDVEGKSLEYAESRVDKRYGFEAAALTGLYVLPSLRRFVSVFWRSRHATLPEDCATLAVSAGRAEGITFPDWDGPPSPRLLMDFLRGR